MIQINVCIKSCTNIQIFVTFWQRMILIQISEYIRIKKRYQQISKYICLKIDTNECLNMNWNKNLNISVTLWSKFGRRGVLIIREVEFVIWNFKHRLSQIPPLRRRMFALKVKIVKFSCTISSISSHCIARCIRVMPSSHFSTPCLHLITSDQTEIWSHLLTFDHICSNGDLLTFAYIWSKIETCFHQDLLMTIIIWNKNTVITHHPCSNGEQSFRQEHFLVTIMTLEWKCYHHTFAHICWNRQMFAGGKSWRTTKFIDAIQLKLSW